MKHLKRLTLQQLAIAAGGAIVVAVAMLSHDNYLGYPFLGLAALCAGAAAKYRNR